MYDNELNRSEREVATYLDGEKTLKWCHRNVAHTQYGIQGWRKCVLSFLSGDFAWDDYTPAGVLELFVEDGQAVQVRARHDERVDDEATAVTWRRLATALG